MEAEPLYLADVANHAVALDAVPDDGVGTRIADDTVHFIIGRDVRG